ncbi:MAG: hypothetical protein IKP83_05350 [Bacteroidales bacterium]|nr:hypothetical protein [Bacteroidales bacterium]
MYRHGSIGYKLAVAFAGCVLLCACRKGPLDMELVAEGFDRGAKAEVSGGEACWVNGETVRINGVDMTVTVSADGNSAYVSDVERADVYRALYPNTLNPTALLNDDDVTVTIPRAYTYRVSHGHQALDLPMVSRATSGGRLLFKHLTAAVVVEVKNDFGIDIQVDSIVVSSDSYQLSGSRAITLTESLAVSACTTATAADRRVAVRFNGGTTLTVASGETRQVQVPVLPVGAGNKFTVTVATHNVGDAAMQYTFSRTQTTGGALSRAQMGYAPAKFGGVFSVAANKQVRFSPGNLQYYCSSSSPQWRFAQHQYDVATFAAAAYAANSGQWIDLFGFANNGCGARYPYSNGSEYLPDTSISKTPYDWGWNNAITNGGNVTSRWRTLTAAEWSYLISDRSGCVGLALVNGYKGMIIIPDNWVQPADVSTFVSGTSRGYQTNIYGSEAKWAKMEVAGAVFLPINGYRDNTTQKENATAGHYWTDKLESSKAKKLLINSSGEALYDAQPAYGMSVRLVRDVQ